MGNPFIVIGALLAAIIVIPFYRVVKGPTVFDRLLGAAAIGTKTVVLICIVGFLFQRIEMFVDIALTYAVLNFVGSIAIAKYFDHQGVKE
ncbi:MAG: pH regulation protein F [Ignavibacteria bacterium]|nr:pH regulation protein F [Ignavibacteria bacterium]